MEELALERRGRGDAVDGVADDGRPIAARWTRIWCVRPVSRRTRAARARPSSSATSKCVTASRGVSVSSERRVGSRAVAADRRLDPPGARARPAADEREVLRSSARRRDERRCRRAVRLLRAGDDEQARRVAVEPVDDPGPLGLRRRAAPCASSAVDERPVAVPGAGMDDDARRLVDDEQVLVLVGDARGRRRLRRRAALAARQVELDLLAAARAGGSSAGRRRRRAPRRREQPLRRSARADLGEPGEEAVEPQPGGRRRDDERDQDRSVDARAARGSRSAEQQRAEQDDDADDDEGVGEVERRPEAEVEEVGHVAEPDAVDEVRDAAADQQPERDGQHRVPSAGAGEEDEHPGRRRRP